MIKTAVNLSAFMKVFSELFNNCYHNNQYRLHERGIYDKNHNYTNYGLGHMWWMHYTDQDSNVELVLHVVMSSYDGRAKVSLKDKGIYCQFVLELNHDVEEQVTSNVVDWLRLKRDSAQVDWMSESLHEQMVQKMNATTWPIVHQTVPNNQEESPDIDDNETRQSDLAVSMQFKSNGDGYCLMVLLVSSNTRNDRYAITVKSPSMFFNHLMLAYQRGFFGKFMHALMKEHKSKSKLSHLLSFRKLKASRSQAVCVTLPTSQSGIPDNSFRIGFVYDVVSRTSNIEGTEYLTLLVDGIDLERNANHFVVFN